MTSYYPVRRGERIPVAIPIIIVGKDSRGRSFKECSRALDVSKYGGLIATSYQLEQGSYVLIENPEISCIGTAKVVWVRWAGLSESEFEAGVEVDGEANLWPVIHAESPLAPKEYTVARTILRREPSASPAKISRARDIMAIESAGGRFIGVQPGLPGSVPDQYIFNDPKSGSTLAVGTGEITAAAVRAKITAARAKLQQAKSMEGTLPPDQAAKKSAGSGR